MLESDLIFLVGTFLEAYKIQIYTENYCMI